MRGKRRRVWKPLGFQPGATRCRGALGGLRIFHRADAIRRVLCGRSVPQGSAVSVEQPSLCGKRHGRGECGCFLRNRYNQRVETEFTNISSLEVLPRASDLQVQWTGANPAMQNGEVTTSAFSMPTGFTQFEVLQCTAPASAGQFTIPERATSACTGCLRQNLHCPRPSVCCSIRRQASRFRTGCSNRTTASRFRPRGRTREAWRRDK